MSAFHKRLIYTFIIPLVFLMASACNLPAPVQPTPDQAPTFISETVAAHQTEAVIEATADNSFTLQVNGRQELTGDNFHRIYSADVTSALKTGKNEITVVANNLGPAANPAGLIAAIRLTYADGTTKGVGTDATWSAISRSILSSCGGVLLERRTGLVLDRRGVSLSPSFLGGRNRRMARAARKSNSTS